jgi:hypothetical protein
VAEKDTKQDSQVTESVQEPQQKKVYDIKGGLKGRGRQIILTSLMMAITAVGALVTLSVGMSGLQASSSGMALFFGAVAFVGWIAMTALAVKNKDRTEAIILAVIFFLNIIGFIAIMLLSAGGDGNGTAGMGETASVGPVILYTLIALPYFAAYPLFEAVGISAVGGMFVVSAALVAVNAWNFLRLLKRRKKSELEHSKIGYMLGYFSGSEDTDNRKDKW